MNDWRPPRKRRSHIGRMSLLALLLFGLFVAGQVIFAAVRISGIAKGNRALALGQVAQGVFIAIALVGAFIAWILIWRMLTLRRDRALILANPQAVVLDVVRTPDLAVAIQHLTSSLAPMLPLSFSAVVDASRLGLWTGVSRPRQLYGLAWEDVSSVSVGEVQERGRRSRCLMIEVSHRRDEIRLPLVVVGRGLAGVFPERQEVLEQLAGLLEEFRIKSSQD